MASSKTEVATLDLFGVNNVDQALELARSQGDVLLASQIGDGDGYNIVLDKSRLVGTFMVVVNVEFANSKNYGEFVTLRFVTKGGYKGKIVDFGTGIRRQIKDLGERVPNLGGLVLEKGLTASSYDAHTNEAGVQVPAGTTYYLDTAPADSSSHID